MLHKHNNSTIRNATVKDAKQLAVWWNDGSIMAHAGFPLGLSTPDGEIALSLQNDTDDTHRRLIIEVDSTPAGEMNYRNKGDGIVEIGVKLCEFSKQNKGIGKIILSLLISSLFDEMGYTKIILDTNVHNKRAQHVYTQLGFTKLRVNENSWTNQIGELQSSIDYELCKEDFISFVKC